MIHVDHGLVANADCFVQLNDSSLLLPSGFYTVNVASDTSSMKAIRDFNFLGRPLHSLTTNALPLHHIGDWNLTCCEKASKQHFIYSCIVQARRSKHGSGPHLFRDPSVSAPHTMVVHMGTHVLHVVCNRGTQT